VATRSPSISSGARIDPEQFAYGLERQDLEARLLQQPADLVPAEEVDTTTAKVLKAKFPNRHAPGEESGPYGQKPVASELADLEETFTGIGDIVPQIDRDADIGDAISPKVQNVPGNELALRSRPLFTTKPRARLIISGAMSTPKTLCAPRRANSATNRPDPHPMSQTVLPCMSPTRAITQSKRW
jgi:hypothetical protein